MNAATGLLPARRCAKISLHLNLIDGSGANCRKEAMHENKYPLVAHVQDLRFTALRSLQTTQGRSRTGLYIIEGIRHLARAVEQCAPIQSIFLEPSVLSNHFGRKLARHLRKRGISGVRLSSQLYRQLTLAAEPQGIGAVLRQQWVPLSAVHATQSSLWLAVESIESPGNLGTIIRTAEACGVKGIFFLGAGCDPCDPAAVRASMGSLFSQKLIACTASEFAVWARAGGVAVVGSAPAGLLDYQHVRYRWPAVLLMGGEKQGLSGPLREIADYMVRIPMQGACDSLNVSVAAGILLFEMSKRRPKT
jgi:RNA methyltransferase, TrmH family